MGDCCWRSCQVDKDNRPGKVTSYFWTVKYCYLRVVWKSSKPLLLENVHYFFALNMHMKYIGRVSDFVVRNVSALHG